MLHEISMQVMDADTRNFSSQFVEIVGNYFA